MKRFVSTCVVVVAALAIIGGRSGWAAQAQKNDSSKSGPAPAPATTDTNYVIGSDDVLNIDVWKEQGISRIVPVRPDGKISLPLLNDIQAAGLTQQQWIWIGIGALAALILVVALD